MPALPWKTFITPEPQQEYLVMASRLPLRSYWQVPHFLRLTLAVRRQLAASEGLVGYGLLADLPHKTFWTVSVWVDDAHLRSFAQTTPHSAVVRDLRPHMNPTTFTTWPIRGDALPVTWPLAKARLRDAAAAAQERRDGHGLRGTPVSPP